MPFTSEQERFLEKFLSHVQNGDAAIFAGSGLSVDSGLVDWAVLLKPVARELNLKIERERDLVSLAQFYVNERLTNRHQLNQYILDYIGINAKPNAKHKALAKLPIDTYWTINYDRLIEDALKEQEKVVDARYTIKQLNQTRTRRDAVIYKMHGDVEHPDDAILIRDDYEGFHLKKAAFITALTGDLINKKFLFLGLSFADPNVNFVLGRVRAQFETGAGGEHFCILRAEQPRKLNPGETPSEEDTEDYEYRRIRQEFLIKDLKRFNITAILVQEYREIDALLNELETRFRRGTVLISGSFDDPSPWTSQQSEAFVAALSSALVSQGVKIITGFGKSIGYAVVTGVLSVVYQKKLDQDRHLALRPFPYINSQLTDVMATEVAKLKEEHRQRIVSQAGIAIFIFGNKFHNGQIIDSPGVMREFELAIEHGLIPVPVNATGSMAQHLYERVMQDFGRYVPEKTEELRSKYESLGQPVEELEQHIRTILEIVTILKGGQ